MGLRLQASRTARVLRLQQAAMHRGSRRKELPCVPAPATGACTWTPRPQPSDSQQSLLTLARKIIDSRKNKIAAVGQLRVLVKQTRILPFLSVCRYRILLLYFLLSRDKGWNSEGCVHACMPGTHSTYGVEDESYSCCLPLAPCCRNSP